ncbi:MAG: NUDIX hydrolase [Rhodospirillaceae bacterium]|jgi:8-oxo-dGTP pyrophosphatase MutT (NUDIX family)|nr:NUDIX hydrolase [Rhodospirillaceae bacterium]MBT4487126.1 NUDIX hydrolase [Rhodospirillaceae bacterium]MBT5896526.1 NUDIX hydrolase [Rhodospirillaceae bacterium]MBT6427668.1 NUDIX hydrolase [Rhodospirillaceae bacterium]MBT7760339.1 NUDIX hydrolase [Rhodospirillaceae bacterium]
MISPPQPTITSQSGSRVFACFPAAVLTIVLNDQDQVLLLCHPDRPGRWEVVNGALEAGETVWDGALRECHEELGGEVKIRPITALHAMTVAYDDAVPNMISLIFVAAYEGGAVRPGDDMAGSAQQWADIDDVVAGKVDVIVPRSQPWLFSRAREVYQLWQADRVDLQIPLSAPHK